MQLNALGALILQASITSLTISDIDGIRNQIISFSAEKNSLLNNIQVSTFENCEKLSEVDLTNCLDLGDIYEDVFCNCRSLKTIILPENGILASLRGCCFSNAIITTIKLPKSLKYLYKHTTKPNAGVFTGCRKLVNIEYYSENNLILIDAYVFKETVLENFSVGPMVTYISGVSFEIPLGKFTEIFCDSNNPSFFVDKGNLYSSDKTLIYVPPYNPNYECLSDTKILGDECYFFNQMITECLFLPNSLLEIRSFCFYESKITKIIIPGSITYTGDAVFKNCYNLKEVVISPNMVEITYNYFSSCSSLISLIIPNGINSIGPLAFEGCTSLTSLYIPDTVENIDETAFNNCAIRNCGLLCSATMREKLISNNLFPKEAFTLCTKPRKTHKVSYRNRIGL